MNQPLWAAFESSHSATVQKKPTLLNMPVSLPESENSVSMALRTREDIVAANPDPAKMTASDPWAITSDQRAYYLSQFLRLQPNPSGFLSGLQAKSFFELSKLPVSDLSNIWELSDVDCDGQLTLSEFSVAMHLVVLRRNNVLLPSNLPDILRRVATSSAFSTVNLPKRQSSGDQSATMQPIMNNPSQCDSISVSIAPEVPPRVHDQPKNFEDQRSHELGSQLPPMTLVPGKDSQPPITRMTHRRLSVSSQSDVVSLAEGIPSFDGRLIPNAQLQHPIPIRANTMAFPVSSPPHISRRAPLHLTGIITKPLNLTNLDSGDETDRLAAPKSATVAAENKFSKPNTSQRPPTPPPRARVRTLGGGDFIAQDSASKPAVNILPPLTATETGGVTSACPSLLPPVCQVPEDISSTMRSKQLSLLLSCLQSDCECVVRTNNELTSELMLLQQRRIALEILLERLTPLEA